MRRAHFLSKAFRSRPAGKPDPAGTVFWAQAQAQTETADAALRDRVLQLIERLDDPRPEARDEAEARLIKLGARALPLLPDPAGITSKERKERLEKVRSQRCGKPRRKSTPAPAG